MNHGSGASGQRTGRRTLFLVLAAVLVCAAVAGAFVILTRTPLTRIPDEQVEVYRAYRYETAGEARFFVLYSTPLYRGGGSRAAHPSEDGATLTLRQKIPLIATQTDPPRRHSQVWVVIGDDVARCATLQFGDTTIWTSDSARDAVPDYVAAYEAYRAGSGVTQWEAAPEEGRITARYADGRQISWDLDGQVLASPS